MATPPSNPDDISQAVKDITVSSIIGSAAMFSRIIISDDDHTIGYYVGRMLVAAIVSIVVGLYLNDIIHSQTMRYAVVGLSGAAAPEIIKVSVRKLLGFVRKM